MPCLSGIETLTGTNSAPRRLGSWEQGRGHCTVSAGGTAQSTPPGPRVERPTAQAKSR